MKGYLKILVVMFIGCLLIMPLGMLHAQQRWADADEEQFKTDITALLKSCDKNFANVKGAKMDSLDDGEIEYACTKPLTKFKVHLDKQNDGSYWLIALSNMGAELVESGHPDMSEIRRLLKTIPEYKVYDSLDGEVSPVPDGTLRIVVAASADGTTRVAADLIEDFTNGNYIKLSIFKMSK